jgi:hypothetical protein
MTTLLLVHAAVTLGMVGLIWFVQVVHYPLFDQVGADRFMEYHRRHVRRTTWVVAGPMLTELASGVLLVWFVPPGVPGWQPAVGLGLLAAVWLSTVFLQVPQHERLATGPNASACRRLVVGNWVRTAAWSLRGGLVLVMLAETVK